MSQQALDLRRSVSILRRNKLLVGIVIALGILVGGGYAALNPPKVSSTALVVLPQSIQNSLANQNDAQTAASEFMATQAVIADSNTVLAKALPHVAPAMTLLQLRNVVQVSAPTSYVISITASGKKAADAEATANAVAQSYIAYVSAADSPVGSVPAHLLEQATSATGTGPVTAFAVTALIGALAGLLVGFVGSLAIGRGDRRLRERDEIANSIGVPVIASIPVAHPSDPAAWTKLLDGYRPPSVHALRLRRALQLLLSGELGDGSRGEAGGAAGVAVITLSTDPGALALGPQLAAYAASSGIRTTLIVGQQQENVAAALLTACAKAALAGPGLRPNGLRIAVNDGAGPGTAADAELVIAVVVVDGRSPRLPDTARTGTALLGVSSGVLTAEQLARAAVAVTGDGREIAGLLVADPDPADQSTGQVAALARPHQHRRPGRLTGMASESRR